MIEIKVPTVGESINEVTLLKWTKKDGEWVERDEVIAEYTPAAKSLSASASSNRWFH